LKTIETLGLGAFWLFAGVGVAILEESSDDSKDQRCYMCGERKATASMSMLRVWVVEWLRRKEEVELKLWFMDSLVAWVPTRRERGTIRAVDFIESESVSLT
jgi:hypothetical protein